MILNVMQHGDLSSITTDTWKTVSEPCENDLTISNVAENTVLGRVQHLPLFFTPPIILCNVMLIIKARMSFVTCPLLVEHALRVVVYV